MRKDRKACIQFMHNLVVQCLLILMEPLYHCLDDDDAKWDAYRAVMWMNPNSEEREVYPFDDEDEDEREAYLNNDYTFVQIASQEFKISQSNDTSPGLITADIQKLCGTLGRRAITLSICRSGDGSVFARKNPINYWNISEFIKDSQATKIASSSEKATEDYLKQNPRSTVERPRYPTRVINTHTLHFEDDQIMFQKDYAVLSHTWSQKAREVTYEDAATALMEIKEKYIMTKILGLQKKMKPTLPERRRARDQSKPDSEIRELQAELDELKMARLKRDNATRSQEQGSTAPTGGSAVDTSKDLEIRDPGKAKLAKALSEARKLGFTYLWVDNVCINKPNNTELVEAISSMGDWYQNSQVCLVYIDDFSGEDISDKNVDMAAKNRYATRGWTLQEIVMCPRAVFYNKSWKKIADTKPNDKDEDEDHQRLLQLLARVCHVPPNLLCAHGKPNVAASRILQLASKRRTFKPEDRAYSLMGMLGIRMRADYGEGQEKAVSRLFESVIHTTADVSVFNWTGKFAASTVVGRSMYPSDFNSYDLVTTLENEFKNTTEDDICNSDQSSEVRRQYDISEWLLNDSEKPAQALGSIMLDYFGVYARFDICEMDIVIEGDNSETLKKLNQLHDKVQNSATSDHVPITDCSCKCTFTFRNGFVANVEVFCPISSLRSILNYLVEPDGSDDLKSRFDDSTSMWVMARFAGVHNSSWFLCEIKQNIQIASYGLFSNVLQSQDVNRFDGSALFGMYTKKKSGTKRNRDANTKMRMPGTLSFMDYLENSGFPAQRLSTTCLPQKGIPNSKELLKNAYMWIG